MQNNENGQVAQGAQDLSKYKRMFDGFTKTDKKKRPSREELLSKFFVPRKDKEYFRMLPALPGRDDIEVAFFHVVAVNAPNGKKKWRKIYCPAHNDPKVGKTDANGNIIRDQNGKPVLVTKKCPLCEKSQRILATQNPVLKGIKKDDMTPEQLAIKAENDKIYKSSLDWQAKKFYIVRGIDKGADKDGVKFWRFKHNYKQQGVLDKLGPAINNFVEINHLDPTDPQKGTDLIITVVDAELPGRNRTYRDVSSIYPRGSSPLHSDPLVIKDWLNDKTTWRDVFKPAVAPNITPEEFLDMVVKGQSPYWDDSDATNKHWVFPGRPDLEALANTRSANLDADPAERNVEMASDLVTQSYDAVTISNVTKEDVGTFENPGVNLTQEIKQSMAQNATPSTVPSNDSSNEEFDDSDVDDGELPDGYEDLPF